jgi:hypothetical protein
MEGDTMIDHVYISGTNLEKSMAFYLEALRHSGGAPFGNYDSASGPEGVPDLYGIADDDSGSRKAVGSSMQPAQTTPTPITPAATKVQGEPIQFVCSISEYVRTG